MKICKILSSLIAASLLSLVGCSDPKIDATSKSIFDESLTKLSVELDDVELENLEDDLSYTRQANWEICVVEGKAAETEIEQRFRELVDSLTPRDVSELVSILTGSEKERKQEFYLWRLNQESYQGHSIALEGNVLQVTSPGEKVSFRCDLSHVFACSDLYLNGNVTAEKLPYVHLVDSQSSKFVDCFKNGADPVSLNKLIAHLCTHQGCESFAASNSGVKYSNRLFELYRELEKFCEFSLHRKLETKGRGKYEVSRAIYLVTSFFWDGSIEIRDPRNTSEDAGYMNRTAMDELYFEGNWAHPDSVTLKKQGSSGRARYIETEAETKTQSKTIVESKNNLIKTITEMVENDPEAFHNQNFELASLPGAHERELALSYQLLTSSDRMFYRIRYSRLKNIFMDPPGAPGTVVENWVINELSPIEGGIRLRYDFVKEWVHDFVGNVNSGLLTDKNSDTELLLVPPRLISTHKDGDEVLLALFPTQPKFELVRVLPKTEEGLEKIASSVAKSDALTFARKVSEQLNPIKSAVKAPERLELKKSQ